MKKAKKVLTGLLCFALACPMVFSGCSSGNQSGGNAASKNTSAASGSTSLVTLKFLEPGNKPKDYDKVTKEINSKLKADGTGVQIERQYISWDAWSQKTNVMIQTNEPFDILPIMEDLTPTSSYITNNALTDITSILDKEGKTVKKSVPDNLWKTFDGKIYNIPAYWREPASFNMGQVRNDLLKKWGLSVPTTPDEVLSDMKIAQSKWTGSQKLYLMVQSSYNAAKNKEILLNRDCASYPFSVQDSFFYVDQKGSVKSWFETPEFKQDCAFMRKAYKMGLINPDILTQTNDQYTKYFSSGDWFISFDAGMGNLAGVKTNNPSATNEDVVPMIFNPNKKAFREFSFQNSVAIPAVSTHPNEAVRFINWLYSNETNYDLFYYGDEGTHYTKDGEHGMVQILDPKNSNQVDYNDNDWMSGNMALERYDNKNGFPAINKLYFTPDKTAEDSIANNFSFDTSKVQTKYVNIQTEAAQVMTPICMGVQDYDTNFAAAIRKMKAAGLDEVVAEYQKQFAAYLAKKK